MEEQFSYLVEGQRKIFEISSTSRFLPSNRMQQLCYIACHTLELLEGDKGFWETLWRAHKAWEENAEALKSTIEDVKEFSLFLSMEMRLLGKFGVPDKIGDLLRVRAEALRGSLVDGHPDPEKIASMIGKLREECCREAGDLMELQQERALEKSELERHERLKRGAFYVIGGAIVVAVDATAVAAAMLAPPGVALSGAVGAMIMGWA